MYENQINQFKGNIFSPLASPNRLIYYRALVVLNEMIHDYREMTVKKDEYLIRLREILEETYFEEESDQGADPDLASHIMRKLRDAGWFYIESDENFKDIITPYYYSTVIIDAIENAASPDIKPFSSNLYNTYSALKIAIESKDENDRKQRFNAVMSAQENIRNLKSELRMLYHEIGSFNQDIAEIPTVNEMLKRYWEEYKTVVDEHYYPIQMEDNLFHYIRPINALIMKIWADEDLQADIIEQGLLVLRTDDVNEVGEVLREALNYIQVEMEGTKGDVEMITDKHSSLIRKATNKIAYLMKTDIDLEGKIVSALRLRGHVDEEEYHKLLASGIHSVRLRLLGAQSLFKPRKKREVQALQPVEVGEKKGNREHAVKGLKEALGRRRFNLYETQRFASNLVREKESISTAQLNPKDDDEIMDLIALSAYQHKLKESIETTGERAMNDTYNWPEKIVRRTK